MDRRPVRIGVMRDRPDRQLHRALWAALTAAAQRPSAPVDAHRGVEERARACEGRQLPEQHRTAASRVVAPDRAIAAVPQRPVHPRGVPHPVAMRVLRQQPAEMVRLVPDRPVPNLTPVTPGDGLDELAEEAAVGLPDAALPAAAGVPGAPRPGWA